MTVAATEFEHQLLALMNASRAAEGAGALTMELNLNQSADDHSQWMSDTRTFSHTGVDNTTAGERMVIAGLDRQGNWGTGENIAAHSDYASETDRPAQQAQAIHDSFMNSSGHRANILNPDFTHVGLGIIYGPMDFGSGDRAAVLVTQNFAYSDGQLDDDIPVDNTPMDHTGDLTAENIQGMDGNDTIDGKGGNDTIDGGGGDDFLKGGKGDDTLHDTQGNNKMNGQKGDDTITSGDGDDRLNGGGNRDRLEAGNGDDFLKGGTRNDVLLGQGDNDLLFGNRHDDTLYGGAGNDTLNGGGDDDRLDGGAGNDDMKGGVGADTFVFAKGRDLIVDYDASADQIELDAALAGSNAANVIANLTTKTSQGALIDFGDGNTLEIIGNFTLAQLEDDISFF